MKHIMILIICLMFFGCTSDTVYQKYIKEADYQCSHEGRGGWKSFYIKDGFSISHIHVTCQDGAEIISKIEERRRV
jgi:hypothetical protein